jgi:hypothetical protein
MEKAQLKTLGIVMLVIGILVAMFGISKIVSKVFLMGIIAGAVGLIIAVVGFYFFTNNKEP